MNKLKQGKHNNHFRGERVKRVEIICHSCSESFFRLPCFLRQHPSTKFCSRKCMGLGKRKDNVTYKETCDCCGIIFKKRVDHRTKNNFCSRKCYNEWVKTTGSKKKSGFWYENGYKVLYLDGNKSIKEHIKIFEDHIQRKLKSNECVHHINGIRDDNRLDNLQLMTKSGHSSYHRKLEKEQGKHLFGGHNNN